MNILYVSKLNGNLLGGPSHSVPAQIKAQSRYDNVFWYNLSKAKLEEWTKDGLDCKNLADYPTGRLKDLPEPFNNPDLVIIEELYKFSFCKLIDDLKNKKIPYIIVPRSQMTDKAQKKKHIKKIVGNLLYFNSMIKNAVAIHYLTVEEKKESIRRWKKDNFVIPNGTDSRTVTRQTFSTENINATYIGRIETYQKGLDLLLSAILETKELLRKNSFSLQMYGPNESNSLLQIRKTISKFSLDDLVQINSPVLGKEKQKVLLGTDVFIMTSRFEGLPMGMIEALSYGLPCIATKGTNLSDKIKEYGAGWTADNEVDSIVCAILNMLKEKDSFSTKGKNALALADEYSWDKIARDSHEMYVNIVEERK